MNSFGSVKSPTKIALFWDRSIVDYALRSVEMSICNNKCPDPIEYGHAESVMRHFDITYCHCYAIISAFNLTLQSLIA
jgi:hypothetical protein